MERKPLNELVSVFSGYAFKTRDFSNSGTPIIKIGNIQDGKIVFSDEYVNCEANEKFIAQKGDVLIAMSGATTGKSAQYKSNLKAYINQRVGVVRTINNSYCIDFIAYLINFNKDDLLSLSAGCAQPNLSPTQIGSILVPIYSLEKQQEIVSVLDKINDIIYADKKQLELYDEMIKSRFIEMFGDEKRTTLFVNCVSQMTKGPFGSAVKKDLYVPESNDAYKVYIQINCIQKNESLGDYYISNEYFNSKMKAFEVKGKDYLITCDGTLGKYVRLSDNPRKGIISASLLRLHLNEDKITPEYFEVMWDNYLLDVLKGHVRNGCLTHLPSAKVIGNEYIYLPSLKEQEEFSSFKKLIDKSKSNVQQHIKSMQELLEKKMDEYFGGDF